MAPNSVKLVEEEGMTFDTSLPHEASLRERILARELEGKRGNLYILFDIEFPKTVTKQQRDQLEALMSL
jgi:hypothetical protein